MRVIQYIFQLIAWTVFFVATRVFARFKVEGRENLKNLAGPLLIIANHRTLADPFIVGTLFKPSPKYLPMGFIVADLFYKNIFLRPFLFLLRAYPAHRGEGLDISLKEPRRLLKNGGVFLIFPAGTRHSTGPAPRPKRGAAVLALGMPNITILPIYIKISPGWGLKDLILRRKKIGICVGESFKLRDKTKSYNVNEVSHFFADEILRLAR